MTKYTPRFIILSVAMKEISKDPRRGTTVPHKMVCVSNTGFVPVNEIPRDPGRQGNELSIVMGVPVRKHEYLLRLQELKKMAESGDIRPARDNVTNMGIEVSDAASVIASGILKHNKQINLGGMFPEVKTCPPKFSTNIARE